MCLQCVDDIGRPDEIVTGMSGGGEFLEDAVPAHEPLAVFAEVVTWFGMN
jgi:hypothetical protein